MARERAAARTEVMRDIRLSYGARVLYYELDQYAGLKGIAWPKRALLATTLGASERGIERYLRELEGLGYISTTSKKYSRLYTLFWVAGEATKLSPLRESRGDKIVAPEATKSTPPIKSVGSLNLIIEASALAPADEEPETPEDQILIGLANRGLATDCRMATKVVQMLGEATVEFFLEVLDRELRQKYRLRQHFDVRWLPQVARTARGAWKAYMAARRRGPRMAPRAAEEIPRNIFGEVIA